MHYRYNLDYAAREIRNRPWIYTMSILGIAIAVALLITLFALSAAYGEAARIPLEEVGADMVVQKYGSVPQAVSGPILSCAVGPITQDEAGRIKEIEGVREMSPALLIWIFDRDYFKIVAGIDRENSLGKLLSSQITEGEFISDRNTAVVEKNFALMHGIKLNDAVSVDKSSYRVVGILAAQGKDRIGAANIIIPMQDAQELAYGAKNIRDTVRFTKNDVNLLFLTVDQDKTMTVKTKVEGILGKNSRVSSMNSFLPQLGSVTAAAASFSTISSLIAMIVAVLLLFKITVFGIIQRSSEIGIMMAVGWTVKDVRKQFMIESLLQGVIGGAAGIILGWFAIYLLGMVDITIPVPRDLAANPFISTDLERHVSLPIAFPVSTGFISFAIAAIIGVVAGLLASQKISSVYPAEVLKNE